MIIPNNKWYHLLAAIKIFVAILINDTQHPECIYTCFWYNRNMNLIISLTIFLIISQTNISLYNWQSFGTKRAINVLYDSIGNPSNPDVLPLTIAKIIYLISFQIIEQIKIAFLSSKGGRLILFWKAFISSFNTFFNLKNDIDIL